MKNILVIGSNGKVGKLLVKSLVEREYFVRSMLRNQEHFETQISLGAEPFLADLEDDFSGAYHDINCVIFTAGSGGHTGPEKTIDIDQNAAIRSMDIALKHAIERYIMVSAQGVNEPDLPSKIKHYYQAKHKADRYLMSCGLNYSIFRPGRLIDNDGRGLIQIAPHIKKKGETSRNNLAEAIAESLRYDTLRNKTIDILNGSNPISKALSTL